MESKRLRASGRRAEHQGSSCNLARPLCRPTVNFWQLQTAGKGLQQQWLWMKRLQSPSRPSG